MTIPRGNLAQCQIKFRLGHRRFPTYFILCCGPPAYGASGVPAPCFPLHPPSPFYCSVSVSIRVRPHKRSDANLKRLTLGRSLNANPNIVRVHPWFNGCAQSLRPCVFKRAKAFTAEAQRNPHYARVRVEHSRVELNDSSSRPIFCEDAQREENIKFPLSTFS